MTKRRTVWARIEEPYLQGIYAEHDNRKVEVIREESHAWGIYRYRDGQMMQTRPDTAPAFIRTHPTVGAARQIARAWLLAPPDGA